MINSDGTYTITNAFELLQAMQDDCFVFIRGDNDNPCEYATHISIDSDGGVFTWRAEPILTSIKYGFAADDCDEYVTTHRIDDSGDVLQWLGDVDASMIEDFQVVRMCFEIK